MKISQYFDNVLSLFTSLTSYHSDQLLLAGRAIHLNTPSPALQHLFIESLSHLISKENTISPELTIYYAEEKDLPGKLGAPPWKEFNAQGITTEIDQEDIQIFFLPWQKQVFLYSRVKRTGIYWVKSAKDVPWWETTFSFRTIFHLWTRDLPAQLVHAGAIANEHSGILITGPGGSGKSTSCLNLVKAGYKYLGDDYVWVEVKPQPVAHALYQTAKIEAYNLHERFNDWIPFIKNTENYNKQKAIFDIKQLFPAQWLSSVQIKAILLPRLSGMEGSSFGHTQPSGALMAMAPTTLHHLPHHREISYQKLKTISAGLPAYNWCLGYNTTLFQSSFHHFIANELS